MLQHLLRLDPGLLNLLNRPLLLSLQHGYPIVQLLRLQILLLLEFAGLLDGVDAEDDAACEAAVSVG